MSLALDFFCCYKNRTVSPLTIFRNYKPDRADRARPVRLADFAFTMGGANYQLLVPRRHTIQSSTLLTAAAPKAPKALFITDGLLSDLRSNQT